MIPGSLKPERSNGWKALKPILEPIFDYGRALRALSNAEQLASRIVADEVDVGAISKFILASAILGILIGKMLPGDPRLAIESIDVPIVGDAVNLLTLLLLGFLNAILVFWPLRWVRGMGSLRHTITASVYGVGATYPVIMFLSGLIWELSGHPLPGRIVWICQIACFGPLWAAIHHLPLRTVLIVSYLANFLVTDFVIAYVLNTS